jgi:energy-coupling factor transporter ATP-binding protein EcfA2
MAKQSNSARVTSVTFFHYKGFRRYSVSLDNINVFTGANNSGKSTIIGAFRSLAVALRTARTRSPQLLTVGDLQTYGYLISESQLPISLENVRTSYEEGESRVSFRLSNGNQLHLHFDEKGCVLIAEARGAAVRTPAAFKTSFPLELAVVPVLGPVEHREVLREKETVSSALATHRASRHFRSYWYHFPDNFQNFAELLESTWPDMVVHPPTLALNRELTMFVREGRIDRESYWVGFGFQIWCQLLTHVHRATDSSLIVVDEPEVYLHPDVQRRLLEVLRSAGPDVIIATHSTEIIAEADPTEIILIDKTKCSSERIKDIDGVQRAMTLLGSQQNISLTALARNRRVIFVEGEHDFSLMRRFAKRLGLNDLAAGVGLAAMPSGGFGSWSRISALAQGVSQTLGTDLLIAAIYDRDYYCDAQIEDVQIKLRAALKFAHVHERKEIENYLLIPEALSRVVTKGIAERRSKGAEVSDLTEPVIQTLLTISDELKDDAQDQYVSKYLEFHRSGPKDTSTRMKEAATVFRASWKIPEERLKIAPGKELLRRFREYVQNTFGVSVTDAKIIEACRHDELPNDLVQLLRGIDAFRQLKVA